MQSSSLYPIHLNDVSPGGRFFDHIFGEFSGDGERIIIVTIDVDDIDPFTPLVHEIDRHTYLVFFRQQYIDLVVSTLMLALTDTDLDDEAAMRTVGVISQQAISAFYSHTGNIHTR